MFAFVKIARIYKALKIFADLWGPIWYKDPQKRDKSHSLLDIIV